MAPLHDLVFGPPVLKWKWRKRRVWWPFLQCERSHRFLFLKNAYYGRYYVDYDIERDMWLSAEEFMLAMLRSEFDES